MEIVILEDSRRIGQVGADIVAKLLIEKPPATMGGRSAMTCRC